MANPENEKRLKNRLLVWFGEKFGSLMLRFFYYTNRWEVEGENHYKFALESGQAVIIAAWHNTFLTVFMNLAKKTILWYGRKPLSRCRNCARLGSLCGPLWSVRCYRNNIPWYF